MCECCAPARRARVRKDAEPDGPSVREEISLALADLLKGAWSDAAKNAITAVIEELYHGDGAGGALDADALDAAIAELQRRLGRRLVKRVSGSLDELVDQAYGAGTRGGAGLVASARVSFTLADQDAMDALARHHLYAVGQHFDKAQAESVRAIGTKAIEAGLTRKEAGVLFGLELGKRLAKSDTYWESFGVHVVTRSAELGRVSGYERAGVEKLKIVAVIDNRTSSVCRAMNGRIILVSKAVQLRDALVAAEDPEAAKEIAPWVKPEAVEDVDDNDLPVGLSLPPYHWECRTRSVAVLG